MDTDVLFSSEQRVWRDLTDPRRGFENGNLEAGLKDPTFENLEIPELFGPVKILVDDHKIKRYAFTQDDYKSWYFQSSPFGERIGHASLLANDLLQLFTTRYAASKVVGLHTEEELWFLSPARVDEQVTLSGTYTESFIRRGQGYVVMEAEAQGEDGRVLLRHRGEEIMKTVPGVIGGRASNSSHTSDSERITGIVEENARQFVSAAEGPLRPGIVLAQSEKTITLEQSAVFARIGEFIRNIHNDREVAAAGGLRGPIIQGQQQVGLLSSFLTDYFGDKWFTSGWIRAKFLQPVYVFEKLVLSGVITAVEHRDATTDRVAAHVWVRRGNGQLATVAWVACDVPTRQTRPATTSRDSPEATG